MQKARCSLGNTMPVGLVVTLGFPNAKIFVSMSHPIWHQLSEVIAPRTVKVFYSKYLFVAMDASST